jgi:hypothetical protein
MVPVVALEPTQINGSITLAVDPGILALVAFVVFFVLLIPVVALIRCRALRAVARARCGRKELTLEIDLGPSSHAPHRAARRRK